MAVWSFVGSLFRKTHEHHPGREDSFSEFGDAAQAAADLRGDRVTPMPSDHAPSSIDNVTAAAKDYGISRLSGESDAMGQASGSYRAAKKRRNRRRG